MPVITHPIFDPSRPVQAPESGYELRSRGALGHYHHQSREITQHNRQQDRLTEEDSMLCGFRGIRHPLQAMLLNPNHGPVRQAMEQTLHASFVTKHRPFVDPSRPEGYTHIVDEDAIPEQEGPVDNSKKKIEWRTNLYG